MRRTDNVFINCPFDDDYKPLLNAIVFTIHECGFIARCAIEELGSQLRIDKIYNIIDECRYGIHDISRTELDSDNNLPRFNMPLELGIFLGCKRYGDDENKKKQYLIIENQKFQYQKYISDIAGLDVAAHCNKPKSVVSLVRDWLSKYSSRTTIPSGSLIWEKYERFWNDLPKLVENASLEISELTFSAYTYSVVEWLQTNKERH